MTDIMQALTANTHPTHRWMPEDDVLSCDNCGVRTYHKDARVLCPATVNGLVYPTHEAYAATFDGHTYGPDEMAWIEDKEGTA